MTKEQIKVIDGHFHIWDLKDTLFDSKQLYPVYDEKNYGYEQYEKDYSKIPEHMKFAGGVYVETMSVQHLDKSSNEINKFCQKEYEYVKNELKKSSFEYVYVMSAALEADNIIDLLTIYKNDPKVKGIRQILNKNPSWPRNESMDCLLQNEIWKTNFKTLKDYGLSFEFQINPHQYHAAFELIKECPESIFIVDHLGTPTLADLQEGDVYWKGMEKLASCSNVFMKLSMPCYIDKDWLNNELVVRCILKLIKLFGIERCMFCSNTPPDAVEGWPCEKLYQAFDKITTDSKFSQSEKELLFWKNAKYIYRF